MRSVPSLVVWKGKLLQVYINGYANVNNNEVSGGTFLLGYKGNLYTVHGDFQIANNQIKFDACGCGAHYALGAMNIIESAKRMTPALKVTKALETAEKFSAGVRGPFNIVSV